MEKCLYCINSLADAIGPSGSDYFQCRTCSRTFNPNARYLYRYELQTAHYAGENRHPQIVILEYAPDAYDFHPAPIGDCWLFKSKTIGKLPIPSYIVEVKEV